MNNRLFLPLAFLVQLGALSALLLSRQPAWSFWFGLYWLAGLATLLLLVHERTWSAGEWVAYGAFCAATATGVLFSLRVIEDRVAVGVCVMGALFISAVVTAMPQGPRARRRSPPAPAAKAEEKEVKVILDEITHADSPITVIGEEEKPIEKKEDFAPEPEDEIVLEPLKEVMVKDEVVKKVRKKAKKAVRRKKKA